MCSYMAAALRGIAEVSPSVVAVVGKGHIQGIAENWEKEISVSILRSDS
jgi:pheromone shutdown protein TraB